MRVRGFVTTVVFLLASAGYADELLYQYEGNVHPTDESAGWLPFDPCEEPACHDFLENGHYVLTWPPDRSDIVNFSLRFAEPPQEPPPTFWVEWGFRSNVPLPPTNFICDGRFSIDYKEILEVVQILGNAVFAREGSDFVLGLDMNEFHTYRFESLDGTNYTLSVDGIIYKMGVDTLGDDFHSIKFGGFGSCPSDPDVKNEWDYIRYGTIGNGEAIVSSVPPEGIIDSLLFPDFDRFTITFDQPGYVFIDDVTVETTGAVIPVVIQTHRLDNGDPETVQIVLEQPLPAGETTKFTFNTGGSPNTVTYTYRLSGVCCLPDDSCTITTDLECTQATGSFHANESCSSQEACCLPDATCQMLDPLCCEDRNGTVQGEGSQCTTPVACCMDGACEDLDPLCCEMPGRFSRQDGAVCEGDLDNDGWDGSCGDFCSDDPFKIAPGLCGCGVSEIDSDLDTVPDCIDQCPGEDDRIDKNNNGIPDYIDHFEFIPTVSTWGMVILTLLILITAKLYFGQRIRTECL